jgi:hypothetical protein
VPHRLAVGSKVRLLAFTSERRYRYDYVAVHYSQLPATSVGKIEPMSGGFIKPQKKGDHQVVIFTFTGELRKEHVGEWEEKILHLKKLFGPNLTGITMKGDPTPVKHRVRK